MRSGKASGRSFTSRLTIALALLLLLFGALVALLGRQVVVEQEAESLQRISHRLARHIVEHWPQITLTDVDEADRVARESLLAMLMAVNPGVQVYVLDADGRVSAYLGQPGMVRQPQVDLNPVRQFLAGAALPLRGTDPMGSGVPHIFSAAMFEPRAGDVRPPGYLYIVLDGQARELVASQLSRSRYWQGAGLAAAMGLLFTLLAGALTFRQLTAPLHRLAGRMREYSVRAALPEHAAVDASDHDAATGARDAAPAVGNEVRAIGTAFADMTRRLEAQAARETRLGAAHREMMAGVAHDLRTPLTALHGHLEALSNILPAARNGGSRADALPAAHERAVAAALAQSNKVRRLTQQLFELASLQSADQVLHRERFRLDELVTDAVQKFDLRLEPNEALAPVMLCGPSPGPIECEGDLQLVERALTNLIDNALRHAPGAAPVRVSLQRAGDRAEIVVEDGGPGLPAVLSERLEQGQSLRDPPIARSGGGMGGLGLAIAQRVALLHGGSLQPLPAPAGGTRLCLALPLGVM
jgi:signal transduction histidine kinase